MSPVAQNVLPAGRRRITREIVEPFTGNESREFGLRLDALGLTLPVDFQGVVGLGSPIPFFTVGAAIPWP